MNGMNAAVIEIGANPSSTEVTTCSATKTTASSET